MGMCSQVVQNGDFTLLVRFMLNYVKFNYFNKLTKINFTTLT